jgi:hypothetical protein
MSFLLSFIQRWLGSLSSVLLTFAGVLFCVLIVGAYWDRRIRLPELVGWFSCGVAVAFYPLVVDFLHRILQSQYGAASFSLLAFTLAGFFFMYIRKKENREEIDTGQYSLPVKSSIFLAETPGRTIRGTRLGAPIVILMASLAVLATGLSAPQVMIGDEVTHYYMLTHQAQDLSKPNFFAEIPMAFGSNETRRYPHSFLWHYGGALIYSATGGSFAAIQLYQMFFLVQLLGVAYLLARDRQGVESRSALAYVLVLASLPLCLIFSVAFYQDVPMTAQILTALYLLRRQKWFFAAVFMSFAIGFKVTAVLFYPAFFLLLFYWQVKKTGWMKGMASFVCALAIVLGSTWAIGRAIVSYAHSDFYPQAQLERLLKRTKSSLEKHIPVISKTAGISDINTNLSARPASPQKMEESSPTVISNNPGDLRIKENYFVYAGIVLWMVVLYGLIGKFFYKFSSRCVIQYKDSSLWLYFVGGTYTLITAWYIRTAPDARFFLPGLPFLLLPLVEKSVCLPKPKIFITILTALAFLQGGYVLQKTYRLRALTPELQAGIQYLREHPSKGHIFMYPEGNYRFFPAQHEWYLGYRLREFWRADNNERIKMLNKFGVSLLVIKKYLVAPVDESITNLGVYPTQFVDQIASDSRFAKTFENDQILIYRIPSLDNGRHEMLK